MNLIFAIGFVCILVGIFLISLEWLTKHGKSLTVPAVTGKHFSEAQKIVEDKGFDILVQDSLFYDSLPPGLVLRQVPEADEVVKINRTVYVTINRFTPPDVDMPNLRGYSFRNAEMVLRNLGLRVGDTTYKADFAKNSVLEQLFNGSPIAAGTKIKAGSKISLVLGSGIGNEYFNVPDLVGRTYEEALTLLDAKGLIMGAVIPNPDVRDTAAAYIYWQRPAPATPDGKPLSIRPGQMIDIRLQVQRPASDSENLPEQNP